MTTEEAPFVFPTQQQQAALSDLKEFNDDKVITWLAVIRSIEPGLRHHGSGPLSSQQLSALASLRDCRDSNIIVWLQYIALAEGKVDPRHGQSVSRSSAPSLRQVRRLSNRSPARSSTASLVPSTRSTSSSYSTPRSSVGLASSLPDLPEGNPEIEQHGHTHWCHECDKYVNTCDGWKRHMKEHETYYPCMPLGPVEDMADGTRCAFCGIRSPDHHHLAEHHTSLCSSNTKGAARKSRKSLMVDHLALHGVVGAAASDLADKWQCTRNRRAFACGFCIKAFRTLIEQLHHIDNEHFKDGQGKSEWDTNKVIKGLLHQPKVNKCWQKLLASDTPLLEDRFRWESPAAEALQLKLETGDESGADLALTAFASSVYDSQPMYHDISPVITIPLLQRMTTDPASIATHRYSPNHQYSAPSSTPISANPAGQFGALVSRYNQGGTIGNEVHMSDSNLPSDQGSPHLSGRVFTDGFFDSNYSADRTSLLQAPSFDDDTYPLQTQLLPNQYPSELDSLTLGPDFDQYGQLPSHLNDNGDLFPLQAPFPEEELSASSAGSNAVIPPSQTGLTGSKHTDTSSLPTSLWNVGGSMIQGRRPNPHEKPLPALPDSREKENKQIAGPEPRSKSPMDIDVG